MSRCGLSSADPVRAALGATFHAEHGRLIAALVQRFGAAQLDLIENAVQAAMLRALERWPRDGVPASPTGWLLRVAHNLAIDSVRRDHRLAARAPLLADHDADVLPDAALDSTGGVAPRPTGKAVPTPLRASPVDDELALMFLCCHPSLTRSAQLALTLKVACGFTAPQIALAFLSDERTIAQRLVRAKQRLRAAAVVFELPGPDELPARQDPLLDVIYLVFNEGHSPSDGAAAIKDELCDEALRLARLLAGAPRTATPAADALAALVCFQAARTPARVADDGSLLLLAEQDRTRWDPGLLAEGFAHLDRAARGAVLTRFHLEAGIAACHAAAASYQATDWPQIAALYDVLRDQAPSPIVEVNRAVAIAMVAGAVAGLDELDAIPERDLVARYPYALAAYAELHASLANLAEARDYLRRALDHQPAAAQRRVLERKLAALGDGRASD